MLISHMGDLLTHPYGMDAGLSCHTDDFLAYPYACFYWWLTISSVSDNNRILMPYGRVSKSSPEIATGFMAYGWLSAWSATWDTNQQDVVLIIKSFVGDKKVILMSYGLVSMLSIWDNNRHSIRMSDWLVRMMNNFSNISCGYQVIRMR